MADGSWSIEFLEENASTAIRRLGADGEESKADQPLARAGWRRFSLAVLVQSIQIRLSELMDGANGFDFVGFSRKPPSWSS
jgi:hypothetical protein